MTEITSRERVKLLLKKEIPDRMGLYEHFWPETLRDYWPKQGYPKDQKPQMLFDFDFAVCEKGINTIPFPDDKEILEENQDWRIIKDGRGASLKYWKDKSGTPEHIAFLATNVEKWKLYRQPLLEINTKRLGDINQIKADLAKAKADGKYSLFGNLFVFELLRATLGDVTFLEALLLEPDWIRDFCQVYLDFFRRHYELLFREAGRPDGFWINEDFGYNKGLFCSPKILAELIMPYERQFVEFLKSYGINVFLHSCGDIRQAIPLFIEAGFDCLHPMEAKAGCSILQIASVYGNKLAYMGNINVVVLSTNDFSVIETEIVAKLISIKNMRVPYFFSSDHSIPPNVNYQTYRYILKLFREHCYY